MSEVEANDGQFNIVDEITNAIACIDHAANEGAYKGWETIQKVLGVRARLQALIVAISQVSAEEANRSPESEDETTAADETSSEPKN